MATRCGLAATLLATLLATVTSPAPSLVPHGLNASPHVLGGRAPARRILLGASPAHVPALLGTLVPDVVALASIPLGSTNARAVGPRARSARGTRVVAPPLLTRLRALCRAVRVPVRSVSAAEPLHECASVLCFLSVNYPVPVQVKACEVPEA